MCIQTMVSLSLTSKPKSNRNFGILSYYRHQVISIYASHKILSCYVISPVQLFSRMLSSISGPQRHRRRRSSLWSLHTSTMAPAASTQCLGINLGHQLPMSPPMSPTTCATMQPWLIAPVATPTARSNNKYIGTSGSRRASAACQHLEMVPLPPGVAQAPTARRHRRQLMG